MLFQLFGAKFCFSSRERSAAREDALTVKKHEQEARDAEYAQEVLDHQALLRVVLEGHREGIRRLYGDRSSD